MLMFSGKKYVPMAIVCLTLLAGCATEEVATTKPAAQAPAASVVVAPNKDIEVSFDTAKAKLKDADKAALANALMAPAGQVVKFVRVRAQSNESGSQKHRQKIADARSKAISEVLIKQGIPAGSVHVDHYLERAWVAPAGCKSKSKAKTAECSRPKSMGKVSVVFGIKS